MTISDTDLATIIAFALQAGGGKVEINAPVLASIARELRDRRGDDRDLRRLRRRRRRARSPARVHAVRC